MIRRRRLLSVQYQCSVLEGERYGLEIQICGLICILRMGTGDSAVLLTSFLKSRQVKSESRCHSSQQLPRSAMHGTSLRWSRHWVYASFCVIIYGCIANIIHGFIPVQSGLKPPPDVVSTRMQFQINHTHVNVFNPGSTRIEPRLKAPCKRSAR